MEKKESVSIIGCIVGITIISYFFNLNYYIIASETITVLSIAIAIYLASATGLTGSKLADKLGKTEAMGKQGKTQLGVIREYYSRAMILAIITIVISFSTLLIENNCGKLECSLQQVVSSIAFGMFSGNLVFMWFITKFILNRQIPSK